MTDNLSIGKMLFSETGTDNKLKKSENSDNNIKLFDFSTNTEDGLSIASSSGVTESKDKKDKPYSKSKIISVLTKELKNEKPNQKSKDNILKGVNSINEGNFKYVLTQFEKIPLGMSLLDLLQNTKQLTTEEKKECLKHIAEQGKLSAAKNNQLSADVIANIDNAIENYNDSTGRLNRLRLTADVRKLSDRSDTLKVKHQIPNGVIDKAFKQGNTGDCWLLASIKALSLTTEGKKLLDDMVSYDEKTKTTTVKFKLANASYQVTDSELKGNNSFSKGDGDVRAVEIAMDKFMREKGLFGRVDIKGNAVDAGLQLLTGDAEVTSIKKDREGIDKALDKIAADDKKNKKIAATAAILGNVDVSHVKAKIGNQDEPLYSAHAYTIESVTDRDVYLVNPHDTSQTLTLDRETFLNYFNHIGLYEFK